MAPRHNKPTLNRHMQKAAHSARCLAGRPQHPPNERRNPCMQCLPSNPACPDMPQCGPIRGTDPQ